MNALYPSRFRMFAGVCVLLGLLSMQEIQAQPQMMPIPPHASNYTGYSRGFWFTAPTAFFLEGVRVPTDASATADQHLFIVRFYAPPPGLPGTAAYDVLGEWYNMPGTGIIPCKILIQAGDHIGVIGHRGTLPATNFNAINSYGNTPFTSDILGQPVSLNRLLYQDNILNIRPGLLGSATGQIGRVELYVGPPCEIPDGTLSASIVDGGGNEIGFVSVPSTVWVAYDVRYPFGAANISVDVDFTLMGESSPAYSATLHDTKVDGINLQNRQMIALPPTLTPGYYLVDFTITTKNSCDEYEDVVLPQGLLLVIPDGAILCSVWPGDVNNDGLVNYNDRRDLNTYIHDANLRDSWLTGPARFLHDADTNPLTYLEWKQQPGIPWQTPEGCYMDADGNGVINNFDYIAIKLNWMHTHDESPENKKISDFSAQTFDMDQNFPNPFNPTTSLRYSVPERSMVRLVVTDMLGRNTVTLVDGAVDTGVHRAVFDASTAASGSYIATITMTGTESGLAFSKTIRMTLSK
ncbi:MAG: hypothetical protein RBU27_11050 [Bacteroidota bacterium]|jgi:hypothetical protein|nr:hypothetical protein [Bacteroidota bacterium]